jgi:uncharacterized membrane protein YccC
MQGRTPTDDVTLTKEQFAQVREQMWRWFWRSPRGWPVIVGITLAPMAVFVLLCSVYYAWLNPYAGSTAPLTPADLWPRLILPLFVNVVGGSLVAWFGAYLAMRFAWEPRYRTVLRRIGFDLCERCDYRLDGLNAAACCPECGMERDQFNQVDARH